MARKKGLGRGLGALIPQSHQAQETEKEKQENTSQPDQKAGVAKEILPSEKKESPGEDKKKMKKAPSKNEKTRVEKITPSVNDAVKMDFTEIMEDSPSPTEYVLRAMQTLPMDQIEPNPDQPRKNFDQQALEDLSESIRTYGILQPIVVQKHSAPGHAPYQIIAGERRYRAAQMAGQKEVPVVLRSDHLEETALLSVVENVQRQDLTPVEEAIAYREIMNERQMTQQELAEALGKSRPYVANTVRLLQLDSDTLRALEQGRLTSSQGRTLLAEKNLKKRASYRKLLLEGKSSVQGLEKKQKVVAKKNVYVVDLEQKLSESLGTPVSIQPRRKGWRVQINCYSEDDMNRLMERLLDAE